MTTVHVFFNTSTKSYEFKHKGADIVCEIEVGAPC